MSDIFSVVKVWLDEKGLAYEMEDGGVRFDLPFGSTSYNCLIYAEGQTTMVISAAWHGAVPSNRIDQAEKLLVQFVKDGDGGGYTLFNRATRQLFRQTSVDVSMIELKPQSVDRIIEAALNPFNVKIFAMVLVLQGRIKAEHAIETYAAWERRESEERMAKLRRAMAQDEFNQTLN